MRPLIKIALSFMAMLIVSGIAYATETSETVKIAQIPTTVRLHLPQPEKGAIFDSKWVCNDPAITLSQKTEYADANVASDFNGKAIVECIYLVRWNEDKGLAQTESHSCIFHIEYDSSLSKIPVANIYLNPESVTLKVGETCTLNATVLPSNATDKSVTWVSSNNAVATVNNFGEINAKASGEATITCTANDNSGVSAICEVTVTSDDTPVLSSLGEALSQAKLLENFEYSPTYIVDFEPTVTYVWGAYNYVEDGGNVEDSKEYFLIYKGGMGIVPGQKIRKGWKTRLYNYNGVLEMVPLSDSEIIGGEISETPEPLHIFGTSSINLDILSAVVYIPNVYFSETTPATRTTFEGSFQDQKFTFYNNYSINAKEAGYYDIIATIGNYNGLQIQPIEYFESSSSNEFSYKGINYLVYNRKTGTCITIPGDLSEGGNSSFEMPNLILPSTVTDGQEIYQVCAIGDYSFYGNKNLVSVTLPNTVQEIGQHAFRSCSNLTEVKLSDSLTKVKRYAFYFTGLASIDLPFSLKSIGSYSFGGCNLECILIPECVEHIEPTAFMHSLKLNTIIVDNCNPYFASSDNVLFDKEKRVLIFLPNGREGQYTIPCSVNTIGEGAFRSCKLESVVLPNSIYRIEEKAFQSCTSLSEIYYNSISPITASDVFSQYTYLNATLFVPEESIGLFKQIEPWKNFTTIAAFDFSEIDEVSKDHLPDIYYDLQGIRVNTPSKGIFIRIRDGKAEKILIP